MPMDEEYVGLEWSTEIEVKPPQTVTFVKRATLTENAEHSLQIATCRGQLEELLSSVDVRFLVTEDGEEKETSEGVFSLGFDTDENYRALIQQCQEQLPDGSMKTLLAYLVGSKAKIVTKGSADCPSESIEADVIGWEMRNITANWIEGEPFVNILAGAALRGIPLSDIASVQPLEQAKLDTLTRALSLAHLAKTNKGAQVTILASTPLSGVTIECQYSLTLPSVSVTLHKLFVGGSEEEQEESVLQTFSVIKNPTHDNWENVSIRYRGNSLEEGGRDSQVISVHASQSALVPVTRRLTVTACVVGVWRAGTTFKALEIHNTTQSALPAGYLQVFDSSRRMVSRAATRIPRLNIGQKLTIPINDFAVTAQQAVTRSYYTTPTAVSIKRGELIVTRDHVKERCLSVTCYEEQPIEMRVQYDKRDTAFGSVSTYDELVTHLSPGETEVVAFENASLHEDCIALDLPQSIKSLADFLQDDRAVVAHIPDVIVEHLRKLTTLYERYWDASNSLKASTSAVNSSAGHRASLLESMASVAGTPYAERYAAQLLRIDDEIHRHTVDCQTHTSEQEKATSLIRKLTRRLQCSVSIPASEEDANFQPHVTSRGVFGARNPRGGGGFGGVGRGQGWQGDQHAGGAFGGQAGGPQNTNVIAGGRGFGGQGQSVSGIGSTSAFGGQGGFGQAGFSQGGFGQGGVDQGGTTTQASSFGASPAFGNYGGPSATAAARPPPGTFSFGGPGTGQRGGYGAVAPAFGSSFSFGSTPAPQAHSATTSQAPAFGRGARDSVTTGAPPTSVSSVFGFSTTSAQASRAGSEASRSPRGGFSFGSASSAVGVAVTAPQAGFRIGCPPDPTPSTGERDDCQASSRDGFPTSPFATSQLFGSGGGAAAEELSSFPAPSPAFSFGAATATTAAVAPVVALGSSGFGSFPAESEQRSTGGNSAAEGAFGASHALTTSSEGLGFRFGEASPLGAVLRPASFVKDRSVDLSQLGMTDHSSAEASSPFLGAVLRSGDGGTTSGTVAIINPFIAAAGSPSEEAESSVESPAVSPAARPGGFEGKVEDDTEEEAAEDGSASESSSSDSSSSSSE